MRIRQAWLGAVVMIGPLLGSVFAKTIAIGEVVPNHLHPVIAGRDAVVDGDGDTVAVAHVRPSTGSEGADAAFHRHHDGSPNARAGGGGGAAVDWCRRPPPPARS